MSTNKLLLIALMSTTLATASYAADTSETGKVKYNNEMSLLIGDLENGFSAATDRSLAGGIQLMYSGIDFPIKPEISFVYSQNIDLKNGTNANIRYASGMLNGVYEFDYVDLLTPYIKAGGGYQYYSNNPNAPVRTGFVDGAVGAKLNIADAWSLKFEALGTYANRSRNLMAMGGLTYKFGPTYQTRTETDADTNTNTEDEGTMTKSAASSTASECEVCPEPQIKEVEKIVYVPAPVPVKADTSTPLPLDITFKSNKASLTDASKESIKKYAENLNAPANKDKKIFIVGNADSTGSTRYNATLSIKRANAVRSEFIKNDVDPSRISVDGLGELNPVADNSTKAGREKNRRAIVIVNTPQ